MSSPQSREGTRATHRKTVVERLECPVDENATYENDRWTNRDLIPIPPQRRTYKVWSYFVYWCISGSNISAYTTGSSLLAYGLNAQQAMACVVIGALIVGMLSVACGWMGEIHHIGFTVSSRFSWGTRGGYFPVVLRAFSGVFYFGIQAYWGGQACSVAIGALIPGFAHMKNTIPLSSHIATNDLIGTLIWYLLYIPLILIPPERLQRSFAVSAVALTCTLLGLTIWSVHTNGGGGPLFHTPNTAASTSWSMIFGITSILGAWGSGTLGQSDWTRYAERRYAPTLSQMVAAPITITVTALLGVVVTSASSSILGELYWSPITLLGAILDYYHFSSGARAAVFFAGAALAFSQLCLNVVLNSVSVGMDISGLWPRFINIRRGAYILAVLGIASNPWQILTSAATFLTAISGFGIFLAPMTGIMLADYLVVRKKTLVIEDLYVGDARSIYWYSHGVHWRAVLAWALGTWPTLPGFIMILQDPTSENNWTKIFKIAFFIGLSISFVSFIAICAISPPPRLGEGLDYLDDSIVLAKDDGQMRISNATLSADDALDEKVETA
ncbi:NCS1 family nucleobase:cation symporter-1 [Athelia psychrophila]|uniref:NCS1 family nucleobase:cation symporter-1 n=1 Tax=Athelia psychrophila TaxID=1759441 RepID=A0A166PSF8_9AGAM|nr:NCS1 family nucleobase:cation symporter-1 [Fibularhizoctonia sp. CBS 109695]